MTTFARPAARAWLALLAAGLCALLAPAGAMAQGASGTTAIDLDGGGVAKLRAQGVSLRAGRPARISRGVLRLPVTKGLVGSTAYLNHGGSLRLRRKVGQRTRSLSISRLQARLGSRSSSVIGSVGGRRFAVFAVAGSRGDLSLNPAVGSASLRGARLALTARAGRAIKRALKLRRTPSGAFGGVTVDALVSGSGSGGGGSGGTGGGGGTPGGSGPPQSGPIVDEPPLLTRPATAVDVKSATIAWHVRDSWIRYVTTEKPVEALEGALAGAAIDQKAHACPDAPASAAPPPLVYSYTLPFASGWYDAASSSAALYSTGGLGFRFPSHGIDLDVKNLELELNGGASRVVARFDGRGGTKAGNKRGVLIALAQPYPGPGAGAGTLEGSIPSGGSQSVFAGFYNVGDGFGCVTVSYEV